VATLRVYLQPSSYFSEGRDVATFALNVAQMCHRLFFHASRHFDNLKWKEIYGKTQSRTESAISGQTIPRAGKEGVEGPGFRSEQAFILAACEREIRSGDSADAVTQFKAHVAATLTT
jgi:hypothetical protein